MEIKEILSTIGEKVSEISAKGIQYLSSLGVNVTNFQAKLISLSLVLILLYLIIKVIEIPKKIIRYGLIIILIILGASIIFSMLG